jgi:hypothetical protein
VSRLREVLLSAHAVCRPSIMALLPGTAAMPSPSCPKCQTEMQEGFIPDHGHQGTVLVSSWVAGPPEPSFWMGLKLGGKELRPIVTNRCPACGYLESYAR